MCVSDQEDPTANLSASRVSKCRLADHLLLPLSPDGIVYRIATTFTRETFHQLNIHDACVKVTTIFTYFADTRLT
jgi:hypothetical protein